MGQSYGFTVLQQNNFFSHSWNYSILKTTVRLVLHGE